jgi:hypothetical protein
MTEMYRDLVSQTTWDGLAVATSEHHSPGFGWLVIVVIGVAIYLLFRNRRRDRG